MRSQLVICSKSLKYNMIFGESLTRKEARQTFITSFCVNPHLTPAECVEWAPGNHRHQGPYHQIDLSFFVVAYEADQR